MMDTIFQTVKDKHHALSTKILVYMDNILIASSSPKAHQAAVHDVLDVFETHDLFLKPEKCIWKADCVNYLGLILEKGVARMDPSK